MTVKNLRKRCNVELVTDERSLEKLAAKPTFISSKIFNENLIAVHRNKTVLSLNKP